MYILILAFIFVATAIGGVFVVANKTDEVLQTPTETPVAEVTPTVVSEVVPEVTPEITPKVETKEVPKEISKPIVKPVIKTITPPLAPTTPKQPVTIRLSDGRIVDENGVTLNHNEWVAEQQRKKEAEIETQRQQNILDGQKALLEQQARDTYAREQELISLKSKLAETNKLITDMIANQASYDPVYYAQRINELATQRNNLEVEMRQPQTQ